MHRLVLFLQEEIFAGRAGADKGFGFTLYGQEGGKLYRLIQLRQPGLLALFHGRHQYFLQPFRFQNRPFRMLTEYRRNPVDADFGGFLQKPFKAIGTLRWRNGNMNPVGARRNIKRVFQDFHFAFFCMRMNNPSLVKMAFAVHHVKGVAFLHAKDAHAMIGFFFGQGNGCSARRLYVKNVHGLKVENLFKQKGQSIFTSRNVFCESFDSNCKK